MPAMPPDDHSDHLGLDIIAGGTPVALEVGLMRAGVRQGRLTLCLTLTEEADLSVTVYGVDGVGHPMTVFASSAPNEDGVIISARTA